MAQCIPTHMKLNSFQINMIMVEVAMLYSENNMYNEILLAYNELLIVNLTAF